MATFNYWLNAVLILRYTQQVLCYYVYDCIQCYSNCKYSDVQLMVEFYPRFMVSVTYFNIVADDGVLIANIIQINLWLNRAHFL